MDGRRPRVIIVEDFVLLQETIRLVLERECDVVATAEDGEEALALTGALAPDIVTIDVSLPRLNGFALAERLRVMSPAPRVLFVTAYNDREYVERAFEAGARGYILKSAIDGEMLPAIRTITHGGRYLSARLRAQMRWNENPLTFRGSASQL